MVEIWVAWFLVAVIGGFAAFETYALITGKMTLSRLVWTISDHFPLFGPLIGLVVGILFSHFWWGGIVCFAPVAR